MDRKEAIAIVERAQHSEITEYEIYSKLAAMVGGENGKILKGIADDELRHYNILKKITGKEFKPRSFDVFRYTMMARIFGIRFALKLMENGEGSAQDLYSKVKDTFGEISKIIDDEEKHELKLLNMLSEEKVDYASSIVLGLNDALVELTGSIAGLSFALSNTKLVGISGLIIGIAASLSMAASSYLSSKEEETDVKDPGRAALYTGLAYITTVILLVLPYFLLNAVIPALLLMLGITLAIIALYSFYMAVVKDESFKHKFGEMALISLSVALISFVIGWVLKTYVGVDV